MMSKSSSKHLTAKMKLLLVTLACVAAAVAAPSQKQKRDILPGDPRYGTDYHHQHHHTHENEVQITPAAGGYVGSYVDAGTDVQKNSFQVPHKTYGPPNHTPGTPVGNGYLAPTTTDFEKTGLPVPSYGVPDSTQQIPQHVSNTYLQPAIQEAKKVHTTAQTFEIPIHDVKTQPTETFETHFKAPAPNAPVTSYGTPAVADVKTTVHTVHDTHVQPSHITHEKVAVAKVPVHKTQHVETKTVVRPEVKAPVKTPVSEDVFQHSVNEFKSVPSTSFGSFDNLGSTSFNSFPSFDTSFTKTSVPSTLYSQQSFDTGFTNYPAPQQPSFQTNYPAPQQPSFQTNYPATYPTSFQSNYPTTHHTSYQSNYPATYPLPSFEQHTHYQVPQPISVHVTKQAPISVPVFQQPHPVHVEYPQVVETKVPVVQHHHVELPKTTEVFQHNVPNFQYNVPSFQHNVQTFQQNVPSFQHNLESFQTPTYQPTTNFAKPIHNIHVEKESVTVENPLQTKTTIKTTNEYVQPTDSNGGYVY